MPVVKPLTVIGDAEPVPVRLPGLDVTVKFVIGEPLALPGVNATETLVAEATVPTTFAGGEGRKTVGEKATSVPNPVGRVDGLLYLVPKPVELDHG